MFGDNLRKCERFWTLPNHVPTFPRSTFGYTARLGTLLQLTSSPDAKTRSGRNAIESSRKLGRHGVSAGKRHDRRKPSPNPSTTRRHVHARAIQLPPRQFPRVQVPPSTIAGVIREASATSVLFQPFKSEQASRSPPFTFSV